jgi:hypothetical protein
MRSLLTHTLPSSLTCAASQPTGRQQQQHVQIALVLQAQQ